MRTLRYRNLAVATLLLIATGCTTEHTTVHTTVDQGLTPAGQDHAAQEALNSWETLLNTRGTDPPFLVATGPVTVIGGMSGAGAADFKQALLAGRLETAIQLPATTTPSTTLIWPGGGTTTVAMESPADTLKELQIPTSPPCPSCAKPAKLKVTAVTTGVAHLASSRGPVQVPTWVFTIEGYHEKIAHLAIRQVPPLFVTLGTGPYQGAYLPTATASIAPDNKTLAITETLAAENCTTGAIGHVFESAHAVSFVAIATPATPTPATCRTDTQTVVVTVTLKSPLGTRLVLDNGMPISITRSGG